MHFFTCVIMRTNIIDVEQHRCKQACETYRRSADNNERYSGERFMWERGKRGTWRNVVSPGLPPSRHDVTPAKHGRRTRFAETRKLKVRSKGKGAYL
jgi:hypothetical protein